jgi:hypothetical protein
VPVTEGVGFEFAVVVADAEAVQPFAAVTVTVHVPAVFTLIVCVVAPVDHE